jgi:hypothetical protein
MGDEHETWKAVARSETITDVFATRKRRLSLWVNRLPPARPSAC